jgi:two-component system response regulator HupR/HoxA
MEYDWPGNIRELENEVERVLTLASEGTLIQPEDLSSKIVGAAPSLTLPSVLSAATLRETVDNLERQLIQDALQNFRWNKTKVAKKLGLSRLGLQKKIDRLEIKKTEIKNTE